MNGIDWLQVVEAFGHYQKRVTPKLRGARKRLIERLAEEYSTEDLVSAVHGYVHFHKGLDERNGFDPRQWFTPESVFRFEKLEGRIELGMDGPWRKPLSHEEQVKARQKAAQERLNAARANREGRLRSVS